jgi:indolepyruvate decarboxylase
MELSTCARYGLDPIVLVLNNGGYATERLILDGEFNDVRPWDLRLLPGLLGAGHAYVADTVGGFEAALQAASVRDGQFSIVDVHLQPHDVSPALVRLGERLAAEAAARRGVPAGSVA